jgi:hypothetical protein
MQNYRVGFACDGECSGGGWHGKGGEHSSVSPMILIYEESENLNMIIRSVLINLQYISCLYNLGDYFMEGEGPLWMKAVFLYSFFFLLLSLFMLLVNSVWSCVSDDAEKSEPTERKSLVNSRAPGIPGQSMRKLKPYEFERLVTIDYDAENYQSSY